MNDSPSTPRVRTSDRIRFRRCRRLHWFEYSGLRNLVPVDQDAPPLWMGTGCHFALEDWHGYHRFPDARDAWRAYVAAFPVRERPSGWQDLEPLGMAILDYYTNQWLPRRQHYKTLVLDTVPQVEVLWELPIAGVDAVVSGTFDRIVTDLHGGIWIMDYKFMKTIDTKKLDMDAQCTAYIWAARQLYGPNVMGIVYQQFKKAYAEQPKPLKRGGFSQAQDQGTTWGIYRQALLTEFGKIPDEYVEYLNYLAAQEDDTGDQLIRRTQVIRNNAQIESETWKLAAEAQDMLDPSTVLYPNPTYDCSYCRFHDPCLAMDSGADVESVLAHQYQSRNKSDSWRSRIAWP